MFRHQTLLGISLIIGTLLVSGCSTKKPKSSPKVTHKIEVPKEQKAQNATKNSLDKNTKIADEITKTEETINALEKKINATPLGTERAKLVISKTQLEEKIVSLQNQQIENAKAFKVSKQQEKTPQ